MKLAVLIRWAIAVLISSSLAAVAATPDKKDKDKAKPASAQAVDSGAFGIFVKGQRVATETFSVAQQQGISTIKSQLKLISGGDSQQSTLRITSSGELIAYDWSQDSGGSLTVGPNNEFLIEKITTGATGKTAEQPFLMPSTSVILDNNFFVQREVLLWRYLASDCKPEGTSQKCEQSPAEFGVLIPQDRTSVRVKVELVGREKVTIRGTERDLMRINLSGESFDWALWVDDKDQFKLMRVAIPADNTEVVRD